MTTGSRVDVVLPAYNGRDVIGKAIESVLVQDEPARIIVVDDGSPDDSAAVARAYDRVTVLSQENRGVSGARNTGLNAATAPYVALIDQDDVWASGKLARQLAILDRRPDVGLVFCDMRLERPDGTAVEDGFLAATPAYASLERTPIGDEDAYLLPPTLAQAIARFNFISPSTVVARRDALLAIGGFDESLRLCDDAECWMRLFTRVRAAVIEATLVRSLVWEGNASWRAGELIGERLRIGEMAARHPERYAAGTAEYFRRERPVSLNQLGMLALNRGDAREARVRFRESLAGRASLTAGVGYLGAALPSPLARLLLRLKRAAGIRWNVSVGPD